MDDKDIRAIEILCSSALNGGVDGVTLAGEVLNLIWTSVYVPPIKVVAAPESAYNLPLGSAEAIYATLVENDLLFTEVDNGAVLSTGIRQLDLYIQGKRKERSLSTITPPKLTRPRGILPTGFKVRT